MTHDRTTLTVFCLILSYCHTGGKHLETEMQDISLRSLEGPREVKEKWMLDSSGVQKDDYKGKNVTK